MQYSDLSTRYVASLYWTYTTLFTVGYGDIHATNTGERFYSTLVTFCACVVFGAIIARIKMVVDSQNLMKKDLRMKMDNFKAFLDEKNVTGTLKSRSKDAYAYYLQMVPNLGEKGFYEELPKVMKHQFVSSKFRFQINNVHFFRNSDMDLISQLIIYSKPQQALKGEVIYNYGDFAEEIAFITRGNVRLVSREGLEDALVGYASTGDFFGDFELYKRSTRVCRYEATYNCKLFTIGYNRFLEAMDENEKSRKKLVLRLKRRYDQFQKAKESALLKGYMDDELKSTLTNDQRRKSTKIQHMFDIAAMMVGLKRDLAATTRQGRQESMTFEAMRTHVLIFEKAWINGETEDIFETGDKVRTAAVAGLKLVKRIGLVEKVSYNFVVWDHKLRAEGIEEHTLDYLEGEWEGGAM